MKAVTYLLLILLAAGAAGITSCKPFYSITARPDPNTSTTGTIGSVKATDGVLPIGENNSPRPGDIASHH